MRRKTLVAMLAIATLGSCSDAATSNSGSPAVSHDSVPDPSDTDPEFDAVLTLRCMSAARDAGLDPVRVTSLFLTDFPTTPSIEAELEAFPGSDRGGLYCEATANGHDGVAKIFVSSDGAVHLLN